MMTLFLFTIMGGLITGCATYQTDLEEARHRLETGKPKKALALLEAKANEEGKDQLLYKLDYGLALHQAGELKKSNQVLMGADRLAEVKDYTSLSREAGSLFINESLIQYKAERFESLLINAYLALNFTLQGDYEKALVECRRLDTKLYKYKREGEKGEKSHYARYLSAMIWEAEKKWDSAYIDYKRAYEINPRLEFIGQDLIRGAWQAGRSADLAKWQKKFPQYNLKAIQNKALNKGELVFIYQQGWIPRKKPRPDNFRFPYLVAQPARFHQAVVEINGKPYPPTQRLYHVGREAIRSLNGDYNYLVAKKIGGFVAKEVAAHQIRQENPLLGLMAWIALHLSDQADLRQWSTLPESFQISRIFLPPGRHSIRIWAQRQPHGILREHLIYRGSVSIRRGEKTFLTERTF